MPASGRTKLTCPGCVIGEIIRTAVAGNRNAPSRTASSALLIASLPRCKNDIAVIGCQIEGTG